MKPEKDAYGQEVLAAFHGDKVLEIVERDDGYIDSSKIGPKGYFSRYRAWPREQREAIKFAKGRVLDIGCGAGRHSLYMQQKGHEVTSIDNSPLAIRICKKRGLKNARVLPIEKVSSLRKNTFDTIIMLGNNFGLFGSYKKAKRLLKALHRITTSDAIIICESLDVTKTNDPDHLKYQRWNIKRGRMRGQLRLRIRFKKYIGNWFDYLIVSKPEMKDILKGTGWKIKKFLDGERFYIAIIEKE